MRLEARIEEFMLGIVGQKKFSAMSFRLGTLAGGVSCTAIMPASPKIDLKALTREVRAIYAELESRAPNRNCTGVAQCCQFKLTGKTPFLTKAEALVAARAVKAGGRKELPASVGGACPLLREDKCLIYDHRPFGCRTHFCKAAGGPYARESVRDLIQRLEALSLTLGGREALREV
jgi:Fe-S-cluster containining protein